MTVLTWWYPKLTRGSLIKVFRMIAKIIRRRILTIPTLRLVIVRSMKGASTGRATEDLKWAEATFCRGSWEAL